MELAIKSLVMSFVCMSGYFLIDSYKQNKKNFLFYLRNFALGIIIFYLLGLLILPKAEASERIEIELQERAYVNARIEFDDLKSYLSVYRTLSHDQRAYYQNKMSHHMRQAKKSYRRAEELAAWYLPNTDEKDKADYCWTAAGAVILGKAAGMGPMSIVIDVILAESGKYLYHCSQQWQEMRFYLEDSKYNYTMAEWCADILSSNGGDNYPSRHNQHPIIMN